MHAGAELHCARLGFGLSMDEEIAVPIDLGEAALGR
jgi:hypothetical protein